MYSSRAPWSSALKLGGMESFLTILLPLALSGKPPPYSPPTLPCLPRGLRSLSYICFPLATPHASRPHSSIVIRRWEYKAHPSPGSGLGPCGQGIPSPGAPTVGSQRTGSSSGWTWPCSLLTLWGGHSFKGPVQVLWPLVQGPWQGS